MKSSDVLQTLFMGIVILAFLIFVLFPGIQVYLLSQVFPNLSQHIYPRTSLVTLLLQHLGLTIASSTAAAFCGITIGIIVTRTWGMPFLTLAFDLTSLAQTFPPVAVIALFVPVLGFGFEPAIVALFLYSLLPIVHNSIAGIRSVQPAVKESAKGMGMADWEILFGVELPIAARVIMAGLRTSIIINIGTATIGAIAGAGGLGSPIVSGLARNNQSFVLQGAITAALLAFIADWIMGRINSLLYSESGSSA